MIVEQLKRDAVRYADCSHKHVVDIIYDDVLGYTVAIDGDGETIMEDVFGESRCDSLEEW